MILVSGCGTVAPKTITAQEPKYDESTPAGLPLKNSGFVDFTVNEKGERNGGILTANAVSKYNELIRSYKYQYRARQKIRLKVGDGIQPYVNIPWKPEQEQISDAARNMVFWIDPRHLQAFMTMGRWAHENRPDDSVWLKVKNVVAP